MITAIVLICALGTPPEACTQSNARDMQTFEVPMIACGMMSQAALARQAGNRSSDAVTRIICGVRPKPAPLEGE